MADNANNDDASWWETGLNWLGNTATNIWNSTLQADVDKAEAEALAKEQLKNETISIFGYDVHKNTLVWVAGGSVLVTLLVVLLRRK